MFLQNEIKKKEINTDIIFSKERGFLKTKYGDLEKVFFKFKKERAKKKVNTNILLSKAKIWEFENKRYGYDINHVTIIMEGPIRYTDIYQTVNSYKHLCKEIILSSYVTEEQIRKLKKIAPNIVILNHDPETVEKETKLLYPPTPDHIKKGWTRKGFQQFYHMKKALSIVKTAFVLKTRNDQVYSNLDIAIKLMYSNDDKVVMFPYYIRGSLKCKYHASDHLFGCTTKNMKEIWLKHHVPSLHYDKDTLIEIAIWKGWMNAQAKRLKYNDPRVLSDHEYGKLCSKLFIVLNEKKHEPFFHKGLRNFSACRQKYIWHENESMEKNTYNYFSGKGCDLGF